MSDFDFVPFDGRKDLIEFSDGYSGETFYWGADGDEYYNAKGEKLKGFFQKFGKGIGKGFKGIGKGVKKIANAIKNVKRKLVAKNKNKVEGAKESSGKAKTSGSELAQQKTDDGKDAFTDKLKPADANTPADKIVDIEGQKLSTVGVPADKPIVVSTDPTTGQKIVGVDYKPEEVTAVKGADGNYTYYPTNRVQDTDKGMSSTMKIGLAVGGVVVLGLIVYLVAKNKGK